MQRITPDQAHPLFDTAATRRQEQAMAAALPPHTLMQRAGRAVAQLAQATHQRSIRLSNTWVLLAWRSRPTVISSRPLL